MIFNINTNYPETIPFKARSNRVFSPPSSSKAGPQPKNKVMYLSLGLNSFCIQKIARRNTKIARKITTKAVKKNKDVLFDYIQISL